jgi:hypothetical protein
MHWVLNETKVQRLIISRTHNGGGVIHPTTPLYLSAIYEDYSHPLGSLKESLQKLQLDEAFLRVILELCQKKIIRLKVADMERGVVKTIYESENVKFVEFRYIMQDRKNVYIASYATTEEGETFDTPWQQSVLNFSANVIKNNIK